MSMNIPSQFFTIGEIVVKNYIFSYFYSVFFFRSFIDKTFHSLLNSLAMPCGKSVYFLDFFFIFH